MSRLPAKTATLAFCVLAASAAGCMSPPPRRAAGSPERPHDFGSVSLLSTRNDGTTRPDYVLVRVIAGAPHYEGGPAQPVLETRFLSAATEGATGCRISGNVVSIVDGGEGAEFLRAAIVADRVEYGPEVRVFLTPRIDWPVGHEDEELPESAGPAAPADLPPAAASEGRPHDYRTEFSIDYAGADAVKLTFRFETRSETVLLREVPSTTLTVRFGQSVLFPTRLPVAAAR